MSITGKQIKSVKKYTSVCIRWDGRMGTKLDFTNDRENVRTIIEDKEECFFLGCFVYMFANQHDTSWQFFVNSLRPADEITFHVRNNSNQYTTEAGMVTEELRARVKRRRGYLETTLSSHTVPNDYSGLIKEAKKVYSIVA